MIEIDRDVLLFILLLTTPVQFWYSSTSKNRAWRSSFHGRVLGFCKLLLIRSIKVPGYPSTNSRTTPPLLFEAWHHPEGGNPGQILAARADGGRNCPKDHLAGSEAMGGSGDHLPPPSPLSPPQAIVYGGRGMH